MHERNLYINRIAPLINTPVIKVITGMRRVGKSCLLKLIIERLLAGNVKTQQIIYINKESLEFDFIRNYQDLHAYVKVQNTFLLMKYRKLKNGKKRSPLSFLMQISTFS
jgi:predicted AAA+ superfamily ATPase